MDQITVLNFWKCPKTYSACVFMAYSSSLWWEKWNWSEENQLWYSVGKFRRLYLLFPSNNAADFIDVFVLCATCCLVSLLLSAVFVVSIACLQGDAFDFWLLWYVVLYYELPFREIKMSPILQCVQCETHRRRMFIIFMGASPFPPLAPLPLFRPFLPLLPRPISIPFSVVKWYPLAVESRTSVGAVLSDLAVSAQICGQNTYLSIFCSKYLC